MKKKISKKSVSKKSVEKTPLEKFTVHYSFYLSDSIEIEAESKEDAEKKVQEMIELGRLAKKLNKMPLGDTNVWVD